MKHKAWATIRALILSGAILGSLAGCLSPREPLILTETEQYYFIPAGVPFKAIIKKGGELQEVVRNKDSWVIDSGVLAKLQESANANILDGD